MDRSALPKCKQYVQFITAERLRELLVYDPLTGVFCWRVSQRCNSIPIGSVAGVISSKGYRKIGVENRKYFAHRLAWLYMTGEYPDRDVDHRNCNTDDNRWSNLRLATGTQNRANERLIRSNTSGFKGVTLRRRSGKYVAQIKKNRIHKYLGIYDSPESAHAAYCEAAATMFGEFARAA